MAIRGTMLTAMAGALVAAPLGGCAKDAPKPPPVAAAATAKVPPAYATDWPTLDTPFAYAVSNSTRVLRATAIGDAVLGERSASHESTRLQLGNKEIEGGGNVFYARCRQQFHIAEAIKGPAEPKEFMLSYNIVERSECFPGPRASKPIPASVPVILLLGEKDDLLKALPDTPENLQEMREALKQVDDQAREVEKEIKAWFAGPREPNTYGAWQRRGDSLRPLLPALLQSTDNHVVDEALLLARDRFNAPEVASDVISVLGKLLAAPVKEEASTRLVACQVLGKLRDPKAIPVLLRAMEDPYLDVQMSPVPGDHGAELSWSAVWRDADRALRQITGANPVEQPNQREPVSGQREKVRQAWLDWWEREGKAKYGEGAK